jgi:NADH-quinone oxidoreductase subunit M
LTAAFFLILIKKVFMGPLNTRWEGLKDMDVREWVACTPLAILMLVLGVFPNIVLNPINVTVTHLVDLLGIMKR